MPANVPTSDEFDNLVAEFGQLAADQAVMSSELDEQINRVHSLATVVAGERAAREAALLELVARVSALEGAEEPPAPHKLVYGASVQGGKPEPFEAQLGASLGLFRSYFQPTDSIASMPTRAQADVEAGRIPLMSTKLPYTWPQVGAGAADKWLSDRIALLGQVPGEVWLCLHHEPRGDGQASDWVLMQQRARVLIDDLGATNVKLVGILNGYSFTRNEAHAYNHPVGSGVDIMGFDSYNPWFPGGNLPWKPAEDVFAPGLTILQDWGYPTLVGEYGVREDVSQPGKAAQWLEDAYEFALDNGFTAISYFNSGANSPDGPWTLTGERLTAFKSNLLKPTTA